MNNRTRLLDNIIKIVLLVSILVGSIGREWINDKIAMAIFFFSLGVFIGFQLYKQEILRMWKKDKYKNN